MRLTLETLPMFCTDCGGCLRWNLGVNSAGHPQATLDGKPGQLVRRYVFLHLLNRKLKPGQRVSSRCLDPLCLSPGHMIARSSGEVLKATYAAGRRLQSIEYAGRLQRRIDAGRTVIDWDKVREIRASEETPSELSRRFGIARSMVRKIRDGLSWVEKLPASSVFTWRPQ